jgi:hypothetical protein
MKNNPLLSAGRLTQARMWHGELVNLGSLPQPVDAESPSPDSTCTRVQNSPFDRSGLTLQATKTNNLPWVLKLNTYTYNPWRDGVMAPPPFSPFFLSQHSPSHRASIHIHMGPTLHGNLRLISALTCSTQTWLMEDGRLLGKCLRQEP